MVRKGGGGEDQSGGFEGGRETGRAREDRSVKKSTQGGRGLSVTGW